MNIDHRRAVILLVCLALLTAACGAVPENGPAAAPDSGDAQADADGSSAGVDGHRLAQREQRHDAAAADLTRADADLVVWADEARSAALRPLADAFAAQHGASVAVQSLRFEQIRDQLQVAGPEDEGPDVFIGAHEWLGELVPGGMVAPLDLGDRAAGFTDVAVAAVTYEGRTYGAPYALSSVALLRNTRHVPTAPASWDDLIATAGELRDQGAVPAGLVLPADPYHLHPIVTAYGGYVFGRSADGHDAADLGIDSPGSIEAAQRLRGWAADGVVEVVDSGAEAQERFFAGDAAFAILDPEATEPAGGGAGSDVGYAVSPVPPVDGGTARPFVRAEAVMVSAFAADAELARRFVLDHVAADDGQAALAAASRRPPAHPAAAGAATGADITGFAASAGDGVPLPAIPETGSVWGPWAEALEQAIAGSRDPRRALPAAAAEVRELTGR